MKLRKISIPHDGKTHEYCLNCEAETILRLTKDGKRIFTCTTCGHTDTRSLYFDKRKSWLADDELWHESVGIFVQNPTGKFLFFERTTMSPFGLTIPAGHVDDNETADEAACRELEEETGIKKAKLRRITTAPIPGDACSAGADIHLWSIYLTSAENNDVVIEEEEGSNPVWLTLDEAQSKPLVFATRHIVDTHLNQTPSNQ